MKVKKLDLNCEIQEKNFKNILNKKVKKFKKI